MKKTIKTILCTLALAVLAVSCQKEINEVEPNTKDTIEISINGLMGEYTQVDATKSSLVNTVRVSWENGDIVYVYDGTQCLGSLVASIDGTEDRYAILSTDENHTVTAPTAGTKLTLVHSPLLTEAPAVSDGAISISLANQNGTKAPFVAYATLDYNDEESINNAIVPFKFATSVIKVNCTGFLANTAINNATLSNVNTACKLTLSGTAAPTVAGEVNGTITRTGDEYFAASKVNNEGVAVFQIAAPVLETASEARVLRVEQGSVVFEYKNFSKKSLDAATSVNTVCFCIPTGSVSVESVSLDYTQVGLGKGSKLTLVATVYPDNAANKSVVWSSSDEGVVTVDASGTVTAVSIGTADITVTTVDGSKTATCTVTVIKGMNGDALPGIFSVAKDRQIHFSKGNLYYGDGKFKFEGVQYAFHGYDSGVNTWGLFGWSTDANIYYGMSISKDDEEYYGNFVDWGKAIDDKGTWYTLSKEEWTYLLETRDNASDLCKKGVTVCGSTNCLILAPDGFNDDIAELYDSATWPIAEAAGLVCLPAAGQRYGSELYAGGIGGFYWSSSEFDQETYFMAFYDGAIASAAPEEPCMGMAVRLVTDVTE